MFQMIAIFEKRDCESSFVDPPPIQTLFVIACRSFSEHVKETLSPFHFPADDLFPLTEDCGTHFLFSCGLDDPLRMRSRV